MRIPPTVEGSRRLRCGEPRHNREQAFGRNGDGYNVSTDKDKGSWQDFAAGEGHQTHKANSPRFVRVPLAILHDSRLLPLEKLLIGRLLQLGADDGRCDTMHELLAADLATSGKNVGRMIAHLRILGGF